jgi:general secretion pathway protein G
MNTQLRRARRGFTIIEIIVVVVIIGVLAAVVAPRLIGQIGRGKRAASEAGASALVLAVQRYQADGNTIPDGATLESFLWTKPSNASDTSWKEPYVENQNALLDAWGNPFDIVVPGKKNVSFDIISYGADGKPGGDGDNEDIIKP